LTFKLFYIYAIIACYTLIKGNKEERDGKDERGFSGNSILRPPLRLFYLFGAFLFFIYKTYYWKGEIK
jgi:hypothetical protein